MNKAKCSMDAIYRDESSCGLIMRPYTMPLCLAGQVRIRVTYTGINRADVLQCDGGYPPPISGICGLEVSGIIDAVGEGVHDWVIGQHVCALLLEGGYAPYVTVDARHLLAVGDAMSAKIAASLVEALATSWLALCDVGKMCAGEHVLIHGGSSGVGMIALQVARYLGAHTYTMASSEAKDDLCRSLGATVIPWDRTPETLAQQIKTHAPQGLDIVWDILGGAYVGAHLKALAYGGRLLSVACMDGAQVQCSMGGLLMKNLTWHGVTLRSQSDDRKAEIIAAVRDYLWDACHEGIIAPHIYKVVPPYEVMHAHELMRRRTHYGKMLIDWS
ncbi:MAG: NAD(P)H-quinone oxidoreductase [Alphaproteobacteria bacterium]|nr:MAG: NAD(P)H-quinone oxidoreductase [Alphaproteobacteria bacterium]TAF14985.1 MAG: NAD(P)H-quinone oxidoreductase [Alphaproteobacteria bacterium]TAF40792.1 MAG: NAD(P)H-quinone oxidoreductase [Alphaproteobacteria bacterium]TAF76639.1 MAG: NAD(P)H-quinone oxidoreductase [Alphaproteobacteria bacterium]